MSTTSHKCGPDSLDWFDNYEKYDKTNERYHTVTGSGKIERCYTRGYNKDRDYYNDFRNASITELGDSCYSNFNVISICLPSTIKKIGSHCFEDSSIDEINLPEGLEEIGEHNFPYRLKHISIPPLIKDLNVNNFDKCRTLKSIDVNENNTYYRSLNGILYNHDLTKILRCPQGYEGQVFIPSTVVEIGDHCFDGCSKVSRIVIPNSVKSIGDYALSGLKIDKLVIPNSVDHLGEGCISKSIIESVLRLPASLTDLPDKFLYKSGCPQFNFIKRVERIGVNSLSEPLCPAQIVPNVFSLPKVKVIGEFGFSNETKEFHLFSSLENIKNGAFYGTDSSLVIRFFSIAPIKIDAHAFDGISDKATLIVPEHTSLIFGNSYPWSAFGNIIEMAPDRDFSDEDSKVSDDDCVSRLISIYDSKRTADRIYIKEIIDLIKDNYLDIDDDETFDEAKELITYNYSFSPAIEPELESYLWGSWPNKYKVKYLSSAIMDNHTFTYTNKLPVDAEYQQELPEFSIPIELPEQELHDSEIHFTDILKFLQNELTLARKSVKVAVSWFTNYQLFKQIKELASKGVKIQLITNNDLINNGGYCLDFNELIEAGVEISLVEYPHLLHDKFCIVDDSVVINGSYNWTRFSANNYENIEIHRNDSEIADEFISEFDNLLAKAEHKCIEKMPDAVPDRPEYDRSAFKQYITEELDAKSREASDDRDKITAIHAASKLNPEYLDKIDPTAKKDYGPALRVLENSEKTAQSIAEMVTSTGNTSPKDSGKDKGDTTDSAKPSADMSAPVKSISKAETQKIINQVKASCLFMAIDVSGSMEQTFRQGHVHNIVTKALEASLSLSDAGEVSVWTFGTDSKFMFNIGIGNLERIKNINCMNEGTYLNKFVSKALPSMKSGTLAIILTDDDQNSTSQAVPDMSNRNDVFWQIITYGESDNISKAISDVVNVSLVSLGDYSSMTDDEIITLLLKDYISWKKASK